MRFPLADWAWPPGPRVAAAHDSGIDGRGADGREKGPMQAASGFQRDKTRPAARLGGPPGTKLSQQAALAGQPGTKLSQQAPKRRFRPILRQQGELCTVSATNTTSRANFIPHARPVPVQNSPSTHPRRAQPVQNSPCRPARRPTRYRTLPARPARRPTRYKILPARPKTLISAHFSPAGRTLYRFRHQHDEQGEKSHAPTPHLSQPTPHLSQPTPHLSQPTPHLSPATCRSPNFACNSIA